ncbi:MAG: peptidase [Thalassolituus sp.]|jgi:GH24 family phage-related lysozyme (muramidase)|nr:MAG: peptidase [Thalassolituus sp.]
MADKIDYKFLSELEGGSRTTGYVPAARVSKSGVTIATGFDLGQRNESDLNKLKLDADLISRLKPYLGVKGLPASTLLKTSPLVINSEQAKSIDIAVKSAHINSLMQVYNSASKNNKKFSELPSEAQTVIASVSFQYGVGLSFRAPKFWKAVVAQDWVETVKVLKAFGDAYPTRRKKEAALLERVKP